MEAKSLTLDIQNIGLESVPVIANKPHLWNGILLESLDFQHDSFFHCAEGLQRDSQRRWLVNRHKRDINHSVKKQKR